jgi:flavin-dependent dehydrogenase
LYYKVMGHDFDLAVVGGSFGGLACARTAAARGLRVLVIDRKPEPGANCLSTGLLVKEVVEAWDVPARVTRLVAGIRLYAPSLRHIDLQAPGYYFMATDLPELMRWLAGQAGALGAELRWNTPWRGADRVGPEGWRLRGTGVTARFLIGADGARSAVARDLGLGRNTRFLCGAEVELTGAHRLDPGRLHCFLDSRLAPGYLGWAVPGCGVLQAGLATRLPAVPDLDTFLERLGTIAGFAPDGSMRVVSRRGGLIPVGGPVTPAAAPGVALIGDAAGQVSPLTAGGIHTAWRYGREAAHAVADHFLAGGAAPHRVIGTGQPAFRTKQWLRWALDRRPPNALLNLGLSLPPLRALAQTVFFHHRGLYSRRAWWDLAACLVRSPAPFR